MCWCLRVYWTVLHNLFVRFFTNIANSICNNRQAYCCRLCDCCCCCVEGDISGFSGGGGDGGGSGNCSRKDKLVTEIETDLEMPENCGLMRLVSASNNQHDYVIVDDIDANYVEIEPRKIETESYYRLVDRATAEDLLTGGREDGACLVRPYKEADIAIKYIVSIYAQQQYFHLFIRHIHGRELYGIGQEKSNELLFRSPSDIIDFYSENALQCINKHTSISLVLKPIVA